MAVVYETILDVGDEVPGFDLESHLGRIVFRDIIYGRWCLLVTIDSAFEPVATTDLGMLARLKEEFDHREIFILVISSDTISNVRQWVADIEELNSTKLEYAIMADPTCSILRKFGCAREKDRKWKVVSNGAFLIDLDATIRYSIRTSPFVGRNWFECLRQFDATMLVTLHPVVCPCNWGQGQKVLMRKDVPVKDVTEYRAAEIKPWFRLAPCPDNI